MTNADLKFELPYLDQELKDKSWYEVSVHICY